MKVEIKLQNPKFCTGCCFLDVNDQGCRFCLIGHFSTEDRVEKSNKTVRPYECIEKQGE